MLDRQWNNVAHSDAFADGRIGVWCPNGEYYDLWNVLQRDRYRLEVLLFEGLWMNGKSDLVTFRRPVNSVRYCDDVIIPVVVPLLLQHNFMNNC